MTKLIVLTIAEISGLLMTKNLLEFNRNINKKHVSTMEKSIKKSGILRTPLIADVSTFDKRGILIADGQHLLSAIVKLAKEMNYSKVRCMIKLYTTKEELISDIANINNVGKSWLDDDYLEAWFKYGKDNIRYFQNYAHLYNMRVNCFPNLPMGTLIKTYTRNKPDFKSGKLEFRDQGFSDTLAALLERLHKTHISGANTLDGIVSWALDRRAFGLAIDWVKLEARIIAAINTGEISRRESREDMKICVEMVYNRI